ncbi:hypothetical protein GFGA_1c1387 [Gluconobacter frateurii NBRC 103465]|nr:hypothetical protein GFGA_1c1387 [Gluconobacter frateurii NBRC 103465]
MGKASDFSRRLKSSVACVFRRTHNRIVASFFQRNAAALCVDEAHALRRVIYLCCVGMMRWAIRGTKRTLQFIEMLECRKSGAEGRSIGAVFKLFLKKNVGRPIWKIKDRGSPDISSDKRSG